MKNKIIKMKNNNKMEQKKTQNKKKKMMMMLKRIKKLFKIRKQLLKKNKTTNKNK